MALCATAFVGSLFVWLVTLKSPLRVMLPNSSRNVHEAYEDLTPDYTRYLKAEMPREDFSRYVSNLRLASFDQAPPQKEVLACIGWKYPTGDPVWWDCSASTAGTYWKAEGHNVTFAKYENGWAYAIDLSH